MDLFEELIMASPFAIYEEFSTIDGAMYTFANNPTMIGILLAICLAIMIYFFYAAFNLKQESSSSSTPAVLGIILALMTTAGSLLHPQPAKQSTSAHHYRSTSEAVNAKWQPLASLGIVGTGSTMLRRKKRRSTSYLGRSEARRR